MLLKPPYLSSLAKAPWWAHPLLQCVPAPVEFLIRDRLKQKGTSFAAEMAAQLILRMFREQRPWTRQVE